MGVRSLAVVAVCLLVQAAVVTSGLKSFATLLGVAVSGETALALLILTTVVEAAVVILAFARGGVP